MYVIELFKLLGALIESAYKEVSGGIHTETQDSVGIVLYIIKFVSGAAEFVPYKQSTLL
jgi:hypothetical protein